MYSRSESYNYEVRNENGNFFNNLLNNYINDLVTAIVLIFVALLTYLIKFRVLPKIDKLETKRNKFNISAEDSSKICSNLGALNNLTGSFKSLVVLFHDVDESGYFTKYSISYQITVNGYETLRENINDLDIRIIEAEIQNMKNNGNYHIVYKNNYPLTTRMKQFMNKQNIVAAYARLLFDYNGRNIGAVYLDFNTEIDNRIITTKVNDLIDTIEAIVSPYYLN